MIAAGQLEPRGRFLSLAVRAHRSASETRELASLYEQLGPDPCRALSAQNQVEAMVGDTLARESIRLAADWSAHVARNGARVRALVERLALLGRELDQRGVGYAAIEGGGVMLDTELPFAAYCASDIDLLVEPGKLQLVARACEALGGESAERGPETSRIQYRWKSTDDAALWLEACEVPFDRNWVALPHRDRSQAWLDRRVRASRAPEVWVLDASDAMTFVAMHTSLHSYVRAPGIRLHVDVDRLATDCAVDWQQVVAETRALGVPTRVFISLAMAHALLGSSIPDTVLDALEPESWRQRTLTWLFRREGIVQDGGPKLQRGAAVLLDALLDDRGLGSWSRSLLLPPEAWMREHFGESDDPLWRRHASRYLDLATRWRPR